MELRLIIMALVCLCIAQLAFATENNYAFSSVQEEQRFIKLTKEIRCSSCQNQNLFDSNASVAFDMRAVIYNMLQEGASDNNVVEYLSARYGDYILFKPRFNLGTLALWLGPLAMLGVAGAFILRLCKS